MSNAILLVDDEPQVLKALIRCLMDDDYEILTADEGEAGLALAQAHPFKVVISDERMPGMSGTEFLSLMHLRYPQTVRMLLTGHASVEAAMHAVNQGNISRFLIKPWDNMELRLAVRMAIEQHDLEMENRKLLAVVRTQRKQLLEIEKRHPEISNLDRLKDGSYRIEELDDAEVREFLKNLQVST
jgi:two-component system, probable response regulator PhcQ